MKDVLFRTKGGRIFPGEGAHTEVINEELSLCSSMGIVRTDECKLDR